MIRRWAKARARRRVRAALKRASRRPGPEAEAAIVAAYDALVEVEGVPAV